ncbi:hypothetical protein BDL97_07G002600 [Sphagnum fallax]|nr:hypothetical protein BDL97_07G002600 [Sphagnum fallax]
MENARKTKMVLEVVPRRCKAKPLWNPKTRTMTQVHSQQTMSTRMQYTWRGRRHEWRGLFGWSYKWGAILGWGSRKEQVTVLRRKVPFVLVERDGKWDQKLGKPAVYVHINMEDAKHPVPLVTVYHQLHPVPSSS